MEGSAAFTVSVVACAWLLRLCGFTEDFSVRLFCRCSLAAMEADHKVQIVRYGAAAAMSSILEAFSVQNDNLTLPLYMWSMLALADL